MTPSEKSSSSVFSGQKPTNVPINTNQDRWKNQSCISSSHVFIQTDWKRTLRQKLDLNVLHQVASKIQNIWKVANMTFLFTPRNKTNNGLRAETWKIPFGGAGGETVLLLLFSSSSREMFPLTSCAVLLSQRFTALRQHSHNVNISNRSQNFSTDSVHNQRPESACCTTR